MIFGRVTVPRVVWVVRAPAGVKAIVTVTFTGPLRRRRCTHARGRQLVTALPGAVNA